MEPAETFVDTFLEHHGVKGMKWGVRKKKDPTSFKNLLSKEGRKIRNQEITKQRDRWESGETKAAYKQAKSDFKSNRTKMGFVRASLVLNEARNQKIRDVITASKAKTGKELTLATLLTAGVTAYHVAAATRNF